MFLLLFTVALLPDILDLSSGFEASLTLPSYIEERKMQGVREGEE